MSTITDDHHDIEGSMRIRRDTNLTQGAILHVCMLIVIAEMMVTAPTRSVLIRMDLSSQVSKNSQRAWRMKQEMQCANQIEYYSSKEFGRFMPRTHHEAWCGGGGSTYLGHRDKLILTPARGCCPQQNPNTSKVAAVRSDSSDILRCGRQQRRHRHQH
ncbi:hypothetical protein CC80DRAFT_152150 [Byssothecium circinans]|uniref:Uncharacterized protein n=1 Tax=Byssothecium circinans TaxID=147558 RepID=A0A6A5TWA2_9PLEO|nr:hypothetical protein CC80DRAFT_152150 [Byssothecium circinans]